MNLKKASTLALLLMAFGGFVSTTLGDSLADDLGANPNDIVKTRTYIGGMGISSTVDQWGDFNGYNWMQNTPSSSTTVTAYPEVDLIPTISRQFGWAAFVGQREGPWAAEFSYWRTNHTATWIDTSPSTPVTYTNPSTLQSINIDFKRYFLTQLPSQPFVSFGISFPWLWVHDFSTSYTDSTRSTLVQNGDETISGVGLNLGAGLEIYIDNNFSIVGGVVERWVSFDQINGVEKTPLNNMYFDNNPSDVGSLEGNGFNFYAGMTLGIQ